MNWRMGYCECNVAGLCLDPLHFGASEEHLNGQAGDAAGPEGQGQVRASEPALPTIEGAIRTAYGPSQIDPSNGTIPSVGDERMRVCSGHGPMSVSNYR